MATKEINIDIDLEQLSEQLQRQRKKEDGVTSGQVFDVRTTVFSLGSNPQVGSRPEASPPELKYAEILKDGLNNPYVDLNWRIDRASVSRAGVIGFNIFRRKALMGEGQTGGPIQFSSLAFDKLSKKIPSYGKFSQEKKAISQIRPSLIPLAILNPQLSIIQTTAQTRYRSSLDLPLPPYSRNAGLLAHPLDGINPITIQTHLLGLIESRQFQKIGHLSYSAFLKKQSKQFVSVTERAFVDMTFKDTSVRYGDNYEYYVTSVTSNMSEKIQSNSIKVFVEDATPVRPPLQIRAKSVNQTEIKVSIKLYPADNVARAIIYRKSEDEIVFDRVAVFLNSQDNISFFDQSLLYGKRYTYRIFLENIHGVLSEPSEITVYTIASGVTARSRSNVFQIPILTAVPDQNSDFIKLVISANDPRVSYYEISRRNLTTHENKFTVPSRFSNYGGNGWETDKVFVDRKRRLLSPLLKSGKDIWSRQVVDSVVGFVDETVQRNHIYQYRIVGRDLYGNKTPYSLATVKAQDKRSVRSPINLRAEVLRNNPLRLKVSWDDDNLGSNFSIEDVFKVESAVMPDNVKTAYRIQRRKLGQSNYETFPLTANNFLIDEVPSLDNVSFSAKKNEDVFAPSEDAPNLPVKQITDITELDRPFGLPPFLMNAGVYFYRVAAVDESFSASNYNEELRVYAIPELSSPENLKARVMNPRVRPSVVKVSWDTDLSMSRPDRWTIERKVDVSTDSFVFLGVSYISEEFFDRHVEFGTSYIYRVRSLDVIGRESDYFEVGLVV